MVAHVEGASEARLRQDESEAVDVGARRDLAALKAELLGRGVGVLASEAVADHGLGLR